MVLLIGFAGLLAAITSSALADTAVIGTQSDVNLQLVLENLSRLKQEVSELKTQDAAQERRLAATSVATELNTMWLIICGALVMFMQAGFSMLEAGTISVNGQQMILLKNLADICIGTLAWFFFGYTFAYRGDYDADGFMDNGFMGMKNYAGYKFSKKDGDTGVITPNGDTTPSLYCHWFFQWAFCSAAATIVSGGVAGRIRIGAYLLYSFCMTVWIYPIVVAWTWGYGWITADVNAVGPIDFAGSGIVHMVGGIGALVGAILLGPRKDRFNGMEYEPSNMPLIVLGTNILWFGWYGFNCGSTLSMDSQAQAYKAALVAMNTTLSAATGGLVTGAIFYFVNAFKYDVSSLCNGILAGLVSITAPCSNVDVGSAIIIGCIGACIFSASSLLMKKLKVDDPLDAFSVHGACGAWGVLAAALFDWSPKWWTATGWNGWHCYQEYVGGPCIEDSWFMQLGANVVEIVMVIIWVAVHSLVIFGGLKLAGCLRMTEEMEIEGDAGEMKNVSPPITPRPSDGGRQ